MYLEEELEPIIDLNVNWAYKAASRGEAIRTLAALEPVYRFWAAFAPPEAYEYKGNQGEADRLNLFHWAGMRSTPEHAAVHEALTDYLRYPFAKNNGVTGYIVANDLSTSLNDLYDQCVEVIMGSLPKTMRNVCATFESKKGKVDKAEGCLLYMEKSVYNFLVDRARKIDSFFGRNPAEKPQDLYEREGHPIASADQLRIGDSVIRKNNRVGTYTGEVFENGSRFAIFHFTDGCDEQIPWDIVPARVCRFTGNIQDIPAVQAEEKKLNLNSSLSLDALFGEDGEEGIALINLLPAGKSAEESLLNNELREILCRTYFSTLRMLGREDFAQAIMLTYFVRDSLCNELTHYDSILRRLEEVEPVSLLRQVHELNCLIMAASVGEPHLEIRRPDVTHKFSVKELTLAKHQAKKRLRENMSIAMAA